MPNIIKLWYNKRLKNRILKIQSYSNTYTIVLLIMMVLILFMLKFINIFASGELSTKTSDYVEVYNYYKNIK